MEAGDARTPADSSSARLFAGSSFAYALAVTVLLLILKDFFRDDPNRDAALLWLLVPLFSSFGCWMAVRAGLPLLRGVVWFGVIATTFLCWIAVFSYGLLFLPVSVLMIVAAVGPWDKLPAD